MTAHIRVYRVIRKNGNADVAKKPIYIRRTKIDVTITEAPKVARDAVRRFGGKQEKNYSIVIEGLMESGRYPYSLMYEQGTHNNWRRLLV